MCIKSFLCFLFFFFIRCIEIINELWSVLFGRDMHTTCKIFILVYTHHSFQRKNFCEIKISTFLTNIITYVQCTMASLSTNPSEFNSVEYDNKKDLFSWLFLETKLFITVSNTTKSYYSYKHSSRIKRSFCELWKGFFLLFFVHT